MSVTLAKCQVHSGFEQMKLKITFYRLQTFFSPVKLCRIVTDTDMLVNVMLFRSFRVYWRETINFCLDKTLNVGVSQVQFKWGLRNLRDDRFRWPWPICKVTRLWGEKNTEKNILLKTTQNAYFRQNLTHSDKRVTKSWWRSRGNWRKRHLRVIL